MAAGLVLPPSAAAASPRELAITDVTMVDTRTGARLPHRTVIVRDGRIRSVEETRHAPVGAAVVLGTGKFLAPGLWDMVTHVGWARASALPTLVATGVTAMRDEGGDRAESEADRFRPAAGPQTARASMPSARAR